MLFDSGFERVARLPRFLETLTCYAEDWFKGVQRPKPAQT